MDDSISFKNLNLLLKLAICTASLPDALLNSFDKKFSTDSNEADVIEQIYKHSPKITNFDPSILEERVSQPEASSVIGAISSDAKRIVKCYNCGKSGHVKPECRVKFCCIHKTNNHAYKDCYKNKKNSSSSGKNSSDNTGSNNNSSNTNSSNSENFQKDKKKQSKD